MNYLWTIWTEPLQSKNSLIENLIYLAMSVSLVSKFSKNTFVYTDTAGKEIIRNLDIPAKIVCNLDRFKNLDHNKWALPKILVQSQQKEPFCHLDHDVLLGKEPPFFNTDITVQCIERGPFFTFHYRKTYLDYIMDGNSCPEEMKRHIDIGHLYGLNVGYLQFNNLDFLQKWSKRAIEIYQNMKTFNHNNNIFPEQFLLYCMAHNENISISPLLGDNFVHTQDDINRWWVVAKQIGYQHIMYAKKQWIQNAINYLENNNQTCISYLKSNNYLVSA